MTINKDTDLREALHRKYADTPKLPEDFSERLMQRIGQQDKKPAGHRRVWLYTVIGTVAASLLLLLTLHDDIQMEPKEQPMVAQQIVRRHNTEKPVTPQAQPVVSQTKTTVPPQQVKIVKKQPAQLPQTPTAPTEDQAVTVPANLHYAKHDITDTVYQAPGRMEEFIVKMANYNHVKGEPLECSADKNDSTVVSMVYVFEDNENQDLFDRLLLAACWYDCKTPGYFLNYSYQQFFFCLKDLRLGLKYLWMAERVNGKILLYSTHSPIEADVSSECYQEYRDKLTHTSIQQKTIEL
ncbi:MAG: hypothetical protein K2H97_01535 [Prevotella sp.]|nr:hypothetical protein [Prevotella sp.]